MNHKEESWTEAILTLAIMILGAASCVALLLVIS